MLRDREEGQPRLRLQRGSSQVCSCDVLLYLFDNMPGVAIHLYVLFPGAQRNVNEPQTKSKRLTDLFWLHDTEIHITSFPFNVASIHIFVSLSC